MARFAARQRLDRDRFLDSRKRFFEAELEVVAQIRAARRAGSLGARIHELAEDRGENVGEALKAAARTAAERPARSAILESGVAEAVISGALLRVFQDIIGFADRL